MFVLRAVSFEFLMFLFSVERDRLISCFCVYNGRNMVMTCHFGLGKGTIKTTKGRKYTLYNNG